MAKQATSPDERGWPIRRKSVLLGLLHQAMVFWHESLKGNSRAMAYLESRGLPDAVAARDRYRIGYAPGRGEGFSFVSHVISRGPERSGCTDREDLERALVAAGLARRGRKGGIYDFFFRRLMFPISDKGSLDLMRNGDPEQRARIVGFGGRHVPSGEERPGRTPPKWLNSPAGMAFDKSRILYGGAWAKGKIKAQREALLLEGYLDVIQAREAGFENAVATLGTSLTEEHVDWFPKSTKRQRMRVVISTDDDPAGRRSAQRSAKEIFRRRGEEIDVRIARPSDGMDPDDLIRLRGPEAFRAVVDEAMTPVARALTDLEEQYPEANLVEMVEAMRHARGLISPSASDREADVQFVHQWMGRRYGVHLPPVTLGRIMSKEFPPAG